MIVFYDSIREKDNKGYFTINIHGQCECLDCGWKGTKEECVNTYLHIRNRIYLQNKRKIKIEKILNRWKLDV